MNDKRPAIVVFAHVPPPDHGQSRMVAAMLRALEGRVSVIHVDARFSTGFTDIGSQRPGKALHALGYIRKAIVGHWRHGAQTLYYVPGPVKWSAVVRDWILLGCLRPIFPLLVLHWHAIGQGEWCVGSDRLRLPGPSWIDRMARSVSHWVMDAPNLSIAVGRGSTNDARALGSLRTEVICNGIADSCPGFDDEIPALRAKQAVELANGIRPLRVLFLSRGSIEKGVIDALEALGRAANSGIWIQATFAGGLDAEVESKFIARMKEFETAGLEVELAGFLDDAGKAHCFSNHDLLLSTSRWESFGLTVVEAMAWGMPVVATSSDGVRGVLPENYPYLAAVADIRDLAERVMCCGIDLQAGRGVELSTLLRKFYLENYTLERYEIAIRDALLMGISK